MRRYVKIAMTSALMIIAPLVMSRLAPSRAQERPTQTEEEGKGKELYLENCQKCHGDQGQGVPRMFRIVGATIVHLGSKQAQEKSDEEIRKSMTDGFGKMEAIPELNSENIKKIVSFVRTLKQEEPKT